MSLPKSFNKTNFRTICDALAGRDEDLKKIIALYGYPPFWERAPNFETLVHIILEQQVSLASAKAAYQKLKEKLIEVTPHNFLALDDDALKACYFSRQKITYTRHLATAIQSSQLNLTKLATLDDTLIREQLTQIKGIGNWTVDVYLMMALQRSDLFPLGDVALMRSIKEIKQLDEAVTRDQVSAIAATWKPYQTVAAFILWHAYLSKRKR
jgi:DNA-3-methyladenine glycosylase II